MYLDSFGIGEFHSLNFLVQEVSVEVHVMEVFFKYRGHEFVCDRQVDVWKGLIDSESEPVAGRDIEALCVVRFFCKNGLDRFACCLWFRFQSVAFCGHFEEAVEDEDELRALGGKSSANDIFLTLATDFLTEAPAFEHLFRNLFLPSCEAPVLRSL